MGLDLFDLVLVLGVYDCSCSHAGLIKSYRREWLGGEVRQWKVFIQHLHQAGDDDVSGEDDEDGVLHHKLVDPLPALVMASGHFW